VPYEVAIRAPRQTIQRISMRVALRGVYSVRMNNERRIIPRLVNEILRLSLYSSRRFDCDQALPGPWAAWAAGV
jgi:hypothetical protein